MYVTCLIQCFSQKSGKSTVMPSWQAPVPTPSYGLAISPVGNYRFFSVCGFISPAYLENNSLKDRSASGWTALPGYPQNPLRHKAARAPPTWPRPPPRGVCPADGAGSALGGRALTLVNWCTMMWRQCRFMSSACVLSAASRIWNGRFPEALPLPRTPRRHRGPGPGQLPAARSAPSHSSPGSACSTPAAGCCKSRSSRAPRTGS